MDSMWKLNLLFEWGKRIFFPDGLKKRVQIKQVGFFLADLSNEQNAGCLGFKRDEILPSYIGIITNH